MKTKDQQITIRCAMADLEGSLQEHENSHTHTHDWEAHRRTIEELFAAFPDILEAPIHKTAAYTVAG